MKIVETVIAKFTEKILADMEKIADKLEMDTTAGVIKQANMQVNNKPRIAKLLSRQFLLSVLKGL